MCVSVCMCTDKQTERERDGPWRRDVKWRTERAPFSMLAFSGVRREPGHCIYLTFIIFFVYFFAPAVSPNAFGRYLAVKKRCPQSRASPWACRFILFIFFLIGIIYKHVRTVTVRLAYSQSWDIALYTGAFTALARVLGKPAQIIWPSTLYRCSPCS